VGQNLGCRGGIACGFQLDSYRDIQLFLHCASPYRLNVRQPRGRLMLFCPSFLRLGDVFDGGYA